MLKKLTSPYLGDFGNYTDMLTSSHINVEEKKDPKLKARARPQSFHTKANKSLSAIGMKYQISEIDLVLYKEKLGGGNFGQMYLSFYCYY